MKKVKVLYDRQNCIGAAVCVALAPEYWNLDDDGKANLKDGVLNSASGKYELEIEVDEENFKLLQNSANSCPVMVIEVVEE